MAVPARGAVQFYVRIQVDSSLAENQAPGNPCDTADSTDQQDSIGLIRETGRFSISIFASGGREMAGLLGKRWKLRPEKLDEVPYRLSPGGLPILENALGTVECRVTDAVAAGDSTVFIAEVVHAEVLHEGDPLTMAEAGFRHAG